MLLTFSLHRQVSSVLTMLLWGAPEMDQIHRQLFTLVLDPNWKHGVESAIDVTLLSRYYERFADHGVTVARRVAFVVTGEVYGVSDLQGDDK